MFVNTDMFYNVYNIISPDTAGKSPNDRITKKKFLNASTSQMDSTSFKEEERSEKKISL
jgi:hypothetical protein